MVEGGDALAGKVGEWVWEVGYRGGGDRRGEGGGAADGLSGDGSGCCGSEECCDKEEQLDGNRREHLEDWIKSFETV